MKTCGFNVSAVIEKLKHNALKQDALKQVVDVMKVMSVLYMTQSEAISRQ